MVFIKLIAVVIICVAGWYTVRFFIRAYDKASGVVEQGPGIPGPLRVIAPAHLLRLF